MMMFFSQHNNPLPAQSQGRQAQQRQNENLTSEGMDKPAVFHTRSFESSKELPATQGTSGG